MSVWRHVRAILLLPMVVAVVVPALLVWWTDDVDLGWGVRWLFVPVGLVLIALRARARRLDDPSLRHGRARDARAWDPTSRLVVRGPYRHVRNPMISGVACLLAGEAALLGSVALLIWLVGFVAVNVVYLPLVEEPGLRRRFGADYDEYCANVPRWLPRLRAWAPPS